MIGGKLTITIELNPDGTLTTDAECTLVAGPLEAGRVYGAAAFLARHAAGLRTKHWQDEGDCVQALGFAAGFEMGVRGDMRDKDASRATIRTGAPL